MLNCTTLLRLTLVTFVTLTATVPALAQDMEGSKDHPLITRMPDYYISQYTVEEFAGFDPTVVGGPPVRWEGKKYSIQYSRKEDAPTISMLQVSRNYAAAVTKAGGKILGSDERRVAAEIARGNALKGVYVEAFNEGRIYQLVIVESGEMTQQVTADAAAMARDITSTGRTAIYGIHFDTGSAVIKPESEAALVQMTKLLTDSPRLNAYVVGHTDNVGSLETNLKLSAARAEAVVKALIARGIAPARLKSSGVGPYSPVAANDSDDGKAQNRRVELVAQ
jgi:OmpA-OmpF porin, OOP family